MKCYLNFLLAFNAFPYILNLKEILEIFQNLKSSGVRNINTLPLKQYTHSCSTKLSFDSFCMTTRLATTTAVCLRLFISKKKHYEHKPPTDPYSAYILKHHSVNTFYITYYVEYLFPCIEDRSLVVRLLG